MRKQYRNQNKHEEASQAKNGSREKREEERK